MRKLYFAKQGQKVVGLTYATNEIQAQEQLGTGAYPRRRKLYFSFLVFQNNLL